MAVKNHDNRDGNRHLLWQRALFKENKSPRTIADSLRMRLHLLKISQGTNIRGSNCKRRVDPDFFHLLETNMRRYGSVVDCQQTDVGLNNYAEPIQSLVGNGKNYSRDWRCGLAFDEVLRLPECKHLTQPVHKLTSDEPFPELEAVPHLPVNINPIKPVAAAMSSAPVAPPTSSVQSYVAPPTQTVSENRHQSITTVGKFQYRVPQQQCPSSSYHPLGEGSSSSSIDEVKGHNGSSSSCGYQQKSTNRQNHFVPRRKKKRKCSQNDDSEEDEDDESYDSHKGRGGVSSFITAKDQFRINQHKNKGCGRGYCTDNLQDEEDCGGPIASGNYGNNKRSLGTRRTPGSKFIPPVKRPIDDDDGQEINDKIRSRVLYNNNKKSGGTNENEGTLPPELEGDKRLKNIEPKMVELIMNEIMDHGAPVQWGDIAGLEFAKGTIKEIVVWPMLRPDIFKGLRGPPKGILLFGPPGTGKTLIGKCIASQVKATFFSISASSLTSKWVGEGEKMVRALFAVSRCYQPAVVFIDEIDSLLSQRSDSEHESSRRIKTEFLVQLDGATTNDDDRLLVIGATNRPQEIDEAARRRLVKRLYIPLPDAPARRQIVSNLLRDQSFELTEQEMDQICQKTKGYSGADMTNLCREAALGPIRDAAHDIQNIAVEQVRPVKYCDFEEAFHSIRPSVSEGDLELYISWNDKYGCGSKR